MTDFSPNPIAQALQLLMAGEGYNFYNSTNLARADDLLVRQRASESLGNASGHISSLTPDFRRRYVPPSSREQPFPPADVMERLRDIDRLAGRIRDIETHIRGLSVPTQDKIWWRFRNERPLLMELINCDYGLVSRASAIEDLAKNLTADDWASVSPSGAFDAPISALKQVMDDRARILQFPGAQDSRG